jgi:hypothetical protein
MDPPELVFPTTDPLELAFPTMDPPELAPMAAPQGATSGTEQGGSKGATPAVGWSRGTTSTSALHSLPSALLSLSMAV